MTEKTNQFNVHKQPMTEDELRIYGEQEDKELFCGRLLDAYGDYGVIILALIEKTEEEWHISTLLMSCRVFGRGVEDAFFSRICEEARKAGATRISIDFVESEKNAPAKDFVEKNFAGGVRDITEGVKAPAWVEVITR